MSRYIFLSLALVIAFLNSLLQAWLGRSTRERSQRLWRRTTVLIAALAFGVGLYLLRLDYLNDLGENRRGERDAAVRSVLEARLSLNAVLDERPVQKLHLENVLPALQAGREVIKNYTDLPEFEIISMDDLSIANERFAYANRKERTILWVERSDRSICEVTSATESDISSKAPRLLGGAIACTHIDNCATWNRARQLYSEEFDRLSSFIGSDAKQWKGNPRVVELAAAMRNTGYFYLCEHILNKRDTLKRAEQMFSHLEDLTGVTGANLANRHGDSAGKLRFLEVWQERGGRTSDCFVACKRDPECPVKVKDLVPTVSRTGVGCP